MAAVVFVQTEITVAQLRCRILDQTLALLTQTIALASGRLRETIPLFKATARSRGKKQKGQG
jgi:hypothetical protein